MPAKETGKPQVTVMDTNPIKDVQAMMERQTVATEKIASSLAQTQTQTHIGVAPIDPELVRTMQMEIIAIGGMAAIFIILNFWILTRIGNLYDRLDKCRNKQPK